MRSPLLKRPSLHFFQSRDKRWFYCSLGIQEPKGLRQVVLRALSDQAARHVRGCSMEQKFREVETKRQKFGNFFTDWWRWEGRSGSLWSSPCPSRTTWGKAVLGENSFIWPSLIGRTVTTGRNKTLEEEGCS